MVEMLRSGNRYYLNVRAEVEEGEVRRIMVFEREKNRNVCSVANGWMLCIGCFRSITVVSFNVPGSM